MCGGGGESGVCNLRKLIEGYGILFCRLGVGCQSKVTAYIIFKFYIF